MVSQVAWLVRIEVVKENDRLMRLEEQDMESLAC